MNYGESVSMKRTGARHEFRNLKAMEADRECDECDGHDEAARAREAAHLVLHAPVGSGERREAIVRQMHRLVPGQRGWIA